MLCALLLDHFIHRSHRNTAVDVCFATVFAVTDDELLRCSSTPSFLLERVWGELQILPGLVA